MPKNILYTIQSTVTDAIASFHIYDFYIRFLLIFIEKQITACNNVQAALQGSALRTSTHSLTVS